MFRFETTIKKNMLNSVSSIIVQIAKVNIKNLNFFKNCDRHRK